MSLVEEYYELNEAEEVSVIWKILQLFFYGCAGGLGVWCGYTIANLRLTFHDRCYLFTEVKTSQEAIIDERLINWENDACCDACQFSMVSSFVGAIIWGALFLMCGKGGKSLTGLPQPWRIVWPSLIFNFIFFVIILCTAINIQKGTEQFCGHYGSYKKNISKSFLENCQILQVFLKKDLPKTAFQLEVVVKTSWGCVLSWFILFLLPLCRIVFVVDFRLYKIRVFKIDDTIQNKKEEILKITNYEEPKKLYFNKNVDGSFEIDEIHPDLEVGRERKTKTDKKPKSHDLKLVNINRLPTLRANAVFYETADIRMLSREKKKKKCQSALVEALGKNKPSFGVGLEKSIKIYSTSEVNSYSEIPMYRYSKELSSDEDDNDGSSTSTNQEPEHSEENESPGGSAAFTCDFGSSRFLKVKKQI